MKPLFYLTLFVLIITAACEKGACPPALPHSNEKDTVFLAGNDSTIHDTILIYNGDSGDCKLKVPNNLNTSENNLSFTTYLQTPKENVSPQTPNVKWFTKTNGSGQYCDSVAFVLNTDTNATTIFPAVSITLPESFTPNNDGTNDKFAVTVQGLYIRYSIKIFNRWGEIVFESNTPNESWDGKRNGTDQPQGTYYTSIEAEFFAKNDFVLYKTATNRMLSMIK